MLFPQQCICYEYTKYIPSFLPSPHVIYWGLLRQQTGAVEGRRGGNYPKTCPTNTKYKLLKLMILFASQTFPITFCLLITEYWSSSLLLVDTQFAVLLIHR